MFTIIIVIIITVFMVIKFSNSYWNDFSNYIVLSILNIFWTIPLAIGLAFWLPSYTNMEKNTYELVALQDGSGISGSFFLGSGRVNSEMVYTLYIEEQEGYKMYQLKSKNTYIKYSEGKPTLITYVEKEEDNFFNNFSFFIPSRKNIIEVPKGTILSNYQLDTQ